MIECRKCSILFEPKLDKRGGLISRSCSECERTRSRLRIQRFRATLGGKAILKAQTASRIQNFKGHFTVKTISIRKWCKPRGVPCDLPAGYLYSLYLAQEGRCALSGRVLKVGRGSNRMDPDSVSVDRKEAGLGYVQGNIRLVTWQSNAARGPWGDEQLIEFCRSVLK